MKLGIDIEDVTHVAKLIGTTKIVRLFTAREIEYLENKKWAHATLCGFYCAKEAFFKAIVTGVLMSHLHDIEVLHDDNGAPYFVLAPAFAKELGLKDSQIALSISHTKTAAVAVCVIN